MKWVSRFLIIFLTVFALLTGIYVARTGNVPWWQLGRGNSVEVPAQALDPQVAGLPRGTEGAVQGSVLEALNRETVGLARKVLPSVVSITTTRVVREVHMSSMDWLATYLGFRREGQVKDRLVLGGFGSGVIVSADGLVVTNHHVIDGMQDILLLLNDGRQLKAEVLASDPETDVAVLKVNAAGLQPLTMGDSDSVQVGEYVMAVGNPYGLHETVSLGNISAKGRAERSAEPGAANMEFLQTDAMINRGHSGGPLVNVKGELIGLNRAIFTDRPNESWQGIAFAIPANTVKVALERILSPVEPEVGTEEDTSLVVPMEPVVVTAPDWRSNAASQATPASSTKPRVPGSGVPAAAGPAIPGQEMGAGSVSGPDGLGLSFRPAISPGDRQYLRLDDRPGLLLESVAQSSMASLSLRSNDFIFSANGVTMRTEAEFYAEVSKSLPFGRMQLELVRDGRPVALPLVLSQDALETPDGSQQM